MQENGFSRAIVVAQLLALSLLGLGGCLSQEDDDEAGFLGPDGSPPPAGNSAPKISGNPPGAVKIGEDYSFTPTASDADGDTLTFSVENKPEWASFDTATGKLSGQPSLGNVGMYNSIRISVSDGQAKASLNGFAISVDQIGTLSTTLSWTAPTENEDGSPLMDLAGYRIYWGKTAGNYTSSVTIDNAGMTTYVIDGLAAGTYEFVATSFNASGVESAYSNPVAKTL